MGRPRKKKEDDTYIQGEFFETNSSGVYVEVRDRLAVGKNIFSTEDLTMWPSTDLTPFKGSITIRPHINDEEFIEQVDYWKEKIKNNILSMSDLTADVLDIVTYEWLRKAKHHDSMITITADDILAYRGVQQKKSGHGVRGGYHLELRKQIEKQIDILRHNKIQVKDLTIPVVEDGKRKLKKVDIESPAIVVSSKMDIADVEEDTDIVVKDQFAWRLRPGDIFTPFLISPIARQTAIISIKALQYSPGHYPYEKRLTRYLAWMWRIRQDKETYLECFTVKKLLERIRLSINEERPNRTKKRFEEALERLVDDKIIKSWEYHRDDYDEKIFRKNKEWYKITEDDDDKSFWPNWRVIIEPPEPIVEYYRLNIAKKTSVNKLLPMLLPGKSDEDNIGLHLMEVRLANEWSYKEIEESIEKLTGHKINSSTLNRIERGQNPRAKTRMILLEWLNKVSTST